MRFNRRKIKLVMFFLTAFALCISLAFVGGHGLAREDTNRSQGNTTTTRTNNPDGSSTVTKEFER